jgi:predicted ArsR family transcriptional regulator
VEFENERWVIGVTVPGYVIGRDDDQLTARERQALGCVAEGLNLPQMARRLGVSKQRAHQLMKALERKGVLRAELDGWWTIVARRPTVKPRTETED